MANTTSIKDKFPHRKLEVYHLASDFFVRCWKLGDSATIRDGFLRSQFLRAALSIKLNIAEGASEIKPAEKARLYRIARRSAEEVASLFDDFPRTIGITEETLEPFYVELYAIGVALTHLILSMERKAKPRGKQK